MKCPKCQHENPSSTQFCGNCGMPLFYPAEKIELAKTLTLEIPIKELERGAVFAGRYEIIEELGKGGMGRVYRVLDKKIHEELALKLIKPEIADSKTIERFSNELKMARRISHKNVCRMYHLSEESGTHYITMEFIPGETLKNVIRMTKQLSIGSAINIAKQVSEGLAEAHRLGVIHRDLKPQNIMIDREGTARIMDFGIARSLETEGTTAGGAMIGTPEYMSPEQTESKYVDRRSDIYSLGIVLFEMLTARVPFEGETAMSIAMKHKSEKPPHPKKFNAQIPEDLSQIILKCLQKDKEKRYQSVEELLGELKRLEEALPTTEKVIPKKKSVTEKSVTFAFPAKRILVPILAFIAVIIIGLVIWRFLPQRQTYLPPSDKPSLAVMYFKNNTGDEGLDHWRIALADLLITDLSQSKLIRIMSAEVLYNILDNIGQLNAESYSSEILKEVASRGRIDRILVGNFTRAEDTFRIDATLQNGQTGELIASESVEGTGERSFYAMVDELTRRIKAHLALSEEQITADVDSRIETITTSSPDAYKLYSEGRTYHLQADYWKSLSVMQKVLEIDPEFAMAWRSVAMSYSNLGMNPAKINAIQKAFDLRGRVSERERYIIEADYYRSWEKSYDKAMEAYQRLLEFYPDDRIGNTNLGILYFELEEWDKAIFHYKRNIQNNPDDMLATSNLAETYEATGLYDSAFETLEGFLQKNPGRIGFLLKQAEIRLYQGKYELAIAKLENALSLAPEIQLSYDIHMGIISLLNGDVTTAEQQFRKLPEGSSDRRYHMTNLYLLQGKFEQAKNQLSMTPILHESLAYFLLRTGHPEEALPEFDIALESNVQAESISNKTRLLHAKGIALAHMKSFDEASRVADELREGIPLWMQKKLLRHYNHLMGTIKLGKGEITEAISFLKRAEESLYAPEDNFPQIQAWFISSLAEAYYKAGDLEQAQQKCEKVLSLHLGRLSHGDFYARSIYTLGMIYEQKGQRKRALEYYERFLELWKDADPGIEEVQDARKRVDALQKA